MADIKEVNGVFGGVELGTIGAEGSNASVGSNPDVGINVAKNNNLPAKQGFWSKFKGFLFQEIKWNQEIKVELTPYQQKVEDEINDFLHQEITWEKVHDFLFQEVTIGRKN